MPYIDFQKISLQSEKGVVPAHTVSTYCQKSSGLSLIRMWADAKRDGHPVHKNVYTV